MSATQDELNKVNQLLKEAREELIEEGLIPDSSALSGIQVTLLQKRVSDKLNALMQPYLLLQKRQIEALEKKSNTLTQQVDKEEKEAKELAEELAELEAELVSHQESVDSDGEETDKDKQKPKDKP